MALNTIPAPRTPDRAEMSTSFARIFIHELEYSPTFSRSCCRSSYSLFHRLGGEIRSPSMHPRLGVGVDGNLDADHS